MNLSISSLRKWGLAFAATLSLLTGITGCSSQSQPATAEEKKAFLGDASQMPANVRAQNQKLAQQSAARAQQDQQQAQRQAPPPKQ